MKNKLKFRVEEKFSDFFRWMHSSRQLCIFISSFHQTFFNYKQNLIVCIFIPPSLCSIHMIYHIWMNDWRCVRGYFCLDFWRLDEYLRMSELSLLFVSKIHHHEVDNKSFLSHVKCVNINISEFYSIVTMLSLTKFTMW